MWIKISVILVALILTGWVWYQVNRDSGGSSACIGCGKCSGTGICILTGEPV